MPAADGDVSTTALGDWFATALFWRPQVALLVNTRTFLPVFMELAPAATLLDRIPKAIEHSLRLHGVDGSFVAAERAAMTEVRIAPTNDRSVLGVMNEFAFVGKQFQAIDPVDLAELSLRLADTPTGPLRSGSGCPNRALAEVARSVDLAEVVPLHPEREPARATTGALATGTVYQLKVTLHDTKPPVWRRILVDGASTLAQLHEAIQAAFGWWNHHLHEFEVEGVEYGVPDPKWDDRSVRLDSVAAAGSGLEYRYDFGDGWRHKIVVEEVQPADAETTVPDCVDGRPACPPEDCGGTWGYRELLEILADPRHAEHTERRDWIGRPFDPEAFDPSDFEINLRDLRLAILDGWMGADTAAEQNSRHPTVPSRRRVEARVPEPRSVGPQADQPLLAPLSHQSSLEPMWRGTTVSSSPSPKTAATWSSAPNPRT